MGLPQLGALVAGVGLLCWVVALGGLAASTAYCASPPERFLDPSTARACWNRTGFAWWSLFFSLFVLAATIVVGLMGSIHRRRLSLLSFILLSCGANMVSAGFGTMQRGEGSTATWQAVDAAVAGFSLLVIVQFALVLVVAESSPSEVGAASRPSAGGAPPAALPFPLGPGKEMPPPPPPV